MAHLVGTLLDANYNSAHADHIHVEPETRMSGAPPTRNPGMTPGVQAIYAALEEEFGPGEYFLDASGRYVGNDPGVYWTHMGGYNRRYIGDSNVWSQHSWWNALDIGPYVGIRNQQKFIDFLLKHTTQGGYNELAQFTDDQAKELRMFLAALDSVNSDTSFVKWLIPDIRKNIITADELKQVLEAAESGVVDEQARRLARTALNKLAAIKAAI